MGWVGAGVLLLFAVLLLGGIAYFSTAFIGRTVLAPPAPTGPVYLTSWLVLTTALGHSSPAVFVGAGAGIGLVHGLVWYDRRRRGESVHGASEADLVG